MTALLSTGRVATLLGVSRQHVVDMCARGQLLCVRVGTHRRIPASEIERFCLPGLTRSEQRSLWLHRAVLGELATDPVAVIGLARDNIERWRAMHRTDGMTAQYLSEWEEILDRGRDATAEALVGLSQRCRELRANSPFAGALSAERRAQVLMSFAACRGVEDGSAVA